MSEETPLHVRVAEVLGWTWKQSYTGACRFLCPPAFDLNGAHNFDPAHFRDASEAMRICDDGYRYVPRYDTAWSATGPLIEKYGISLHWTITERWAATGPAHTAHWREYDESPLVAACRTIIALAEMECLDEAAAGKLSSSEPKP